MRITAHEHSRGRLHTTFVPLQGTISGAEFMLGNANSFESLTINRALVYSNYNERD
jgi:hypothetical protein